MWRVDSLEKTDAGRDWRQEKGMTEDEMAGWHHGLDGHESEWTPGVSDEQGGLACCDSWGHKESDTIERLNWTEREIITEFNCFFCLFVFKALCSNYDITKTDYVYRGPWRKKWQPTTLFLPGKVHRQRSLAGYSPWGHKKSETAEQLTLHNRGHYFFFSLKINQEFDSLEHL